ncbi:GNAT family N-acetyltransferase [Deinococcus sedimenti]|uniref:N-acetyltransferase domain-containing protein n=1 Tax=Deinococcus sedimenti TaxID=1867090 RepID=A0ABQ2SA25_9DEIO|nr:GNAT family N-acetyltransferase [Deinococcus sedimenti]GGS09664.1 hypothetical protein GCM10008960_39930 [Deinococcus sedimenti]
MTWRDWTGSTRDCEALARLTTAQYPDAPLTTDDVARDWQLRPSDQPFLVRFALDGGCEVALVETYPQSPGSFLLELIAPEDALGTAGAALLEHAGQWAAAHGAERWTLTLRAGDTRSDWLEQQGFELRLISTEWTYWGPGLATPPAGISFQRVGSDPDRQEALRAALNQGRKELNLPAFTRDAFRRDVLNFGLDRPDLLWLAQAAAGDVVGCLCLHVWDTARHGECSWVSVSPAWQRRGVAASLLAAASEVAQLSRVTANLPAHRRDCDTLLSRAGFRPSTEWLQAERPVR